MQTRHAVITLALVLSACGGKSQVESFRSGIPQSSLLELAAPGARTGSSSQGLAVQEQALTDGTGVTSGFYVLTRDVTRGVNGTVLIALGVLRAVVETEPTSVNGNVAVWGPHSEALSANAWKLTVTEVQTNEYTWTLEGRGKSEPDTAFRMIANGSHSAQADDRYGKGEFTFDWDQAQTLPEHDSNVGSVHVAYSRLDAASEAQVDVTFDQVKDLFNPLVRVDAAYRYQATPGMGGSFEFMVDKNIHTDAAHPLAEKLSIKSRWQEAGAGRSDVSLAGGDLGGTGTMNECWDTEFHSRYFAVALENNSGGNAGLNFGTEATDCAFTSAEYSTL